MRTTKRRLETFSFYDHTGIALHLSKMAEKGWMIEKISNFGWTYRRIAPKKLAFSVSYYPKASEFDPEPTEEQIAFHDFCEHTGWILAVSAAQMQIFYNEVKNPTPIETDPVIEVETIHAAAKKGYLPAYFLLLLSSILDGALFVSGLLGDLIGLLSSTTQLFTGFAWFLLFILCVRELGGYFSWYTKAKKAAEQGEFLETHSHPLAQKVILGLVLASFVFWLFTLSFSGSPIMGIVGLIAFISVVAVIALANGMKGLLKRGKASRDVNRIVTILFCFVLSFSMIGITVLGMVRGKGKGLLGQEKKVRAYHGTTFAAYMDRFPLTVEDLLDVQYDGYVRERSSKESLFLGQFTMWQHPPYETGNFMGVPTLEYTITEIKLPFLYEPCKNSLLNKRKDEIYNGRVIFANHYDPTDATPWGAEEAYRFCGGGEYYDQYLLCYDKRLIEITFLWRPTSEQMAVVADRLSGEVK